MWCWTETDEEAFLGCLALIILAPVALFIFFSHQILNFIANYFNIIVLISIGLPVILSIIAMITRRKHFLTLILNIVAVSQLVFYLYYFGPIILNIAWTSDGPISSIFTGIWSGIKCILWILYGLVDVVFTCLAPISGMSKKNDEDASNILSLVILIVGWIINLLLVII